MEIDFKEIYQLPLSVSGITGIYVHSFNGVKTFTVLHKDKEFVKHIIDILNDRVPNDIDKEVTYDKEEGFIYIDGEYLFRLRGWGFLTGGGGLNLPSERAIKVQHDFGKWVVSKLTNK